MTYQGVAIAQLGSKGFWDFKIPKAKCTNFCIKAPINCILTLLNLTTHRWKLTAAGMIIWQLINEIEYLQKRVQELEKKQSTPG